MGKRRESAAVVHVSSRRVGNYLFRWRKPLLDPKPFILIGHVILARHERLHLLIYLLGPQVGRPDAELRHIRTGHFVRKECRITRLTFSLRETSTEQQSWGYFTILIYGPR